MVMYKICDPVFMCCILRCVGQSDWFRTDQKGKFNWDFLNNKGTPLEDVDMSYTVINYTGLVNLGTELQSSLSFFQILLF